MKIALLTDGIHPYVIGGMQKHSYYLAKYLALNGIEVDLYHTSFRGNKTTDMEQLNCFTREERKNISSIVIDFPLHKRFPGHYLRESYEYSCTVYEKLISRENVDFIYAKGFSGWKAIIERSSGKFLPPIGVNFHGYEMFQAHSSFHSFLSQFILKKTVKELILKSDYVFSYGGKITDIIKRLKVVSNKIIEMPTAIESSWLVNTIKPVSDLRKFIFIGRYENRKGIKELTRAITLFEEGVFEFHFIGNIPIEKKIIRQDVFYHGMIQDKTTIQQIIKSCDVLVCPSYSEGMPNVILEGMACGLAIIATDVGAVNCMVSEKNGWILKSPAAVLIKEAMLNAVNSSDKSILAMKQASIHIVKQNFLWEDLIQKLVTSLRKESLKKLSLE